jgi:hypothetical protein
MTTLRGIHRFSGLGPNSTLRQQNKQTTASVQNLQGSDLAPPLRKRGEDTSGSRRIPLFQGFQALPQLARGAIFQEIFVVEHARDASVIQLEQTFVGEHREPIQKLPNRVCHTLVDL